MNIKKQDEPASVVPLDMDELSDSVVSGRFNAGSSVVWDSAAVVPDGLTGRDGDGWEFQIRRKLAEKARKAMSNLAQKKKKRCLERLCV